jgi:hypothetical protein
VVIFDEYQKKEIINLKTRVTLNVLPDRNPRRRPRKDPVVTALILNHSKVNLEKDSAANEKPGTFLYIEIPKRQLTLEPKSLSHPKS